MNKNNIVGIGIVLAMLLVFAAPAMAMECGDANCDGDVTMGDALLIRNHLSQGFSLNCYICECFAEWVNEYHGYRPNLENCDEDAQGFYNELSSDVYWEGYHIYGDDSAWEIDWKDPDNGGCDDDMADNAEFAYFAGHGEPTMGGDLASFIFGTEYADHHLTCEDALWGNTRMNWVAFSSCRVLNHAELTWMCWANNAFEGLHSICGFDTECYDSANRGLWFAEYMIHDEMTNRRLETGN